MKERFNRSKPHITILGIGFTGIIIDDPIIRIPEPIPMPPFSDEWFHKEVERMKKQVMESVGIPPHKLFRSEVYQKAKENALAKDEKRVTISEDDLVKEKVC